MLRSRPELHLSGLVLGLLIGAVFFTTNGAILAIGISAVLGVLLGALVGAGVGIAASDLVRTREWNAFWILHTYVAALYAKILIGAFVVALLVIFVAIVNAVADGDMRWAVAGGVLGAVLSAALWQFVEQLLAEDGSTNQSFLRAVVVDVYERANGGRSGSAFAGALIGMTVGVELAIVVGAVAGVVQERVSTVAAVAMGIAVLGTLLGMARVLLPDLIAAQRKSHPAE